MRLMSAGVNVSAATSAITIPSARTIPKDLTIENEHMESAPNPMMTERPDVKTDSPAHWTDVFNAVE